MVRATGYQLPERQGAWHFLATGRPITQVSLRRATCYPAVSRRVSWGASREIPRTRALARGLLMGAAPMSLGGMFAAPTGGAHQVARLPCVRPGPPVEKGGAPNICPLSAPLRYEDAGRPKAGGIFGYRAPPHHTQPASRAPVAGQIQPGAKVKLGPPGAALGPYFGMPEYSHGAGRRGRPARVAALSHSEPFLRRGCGRFDRARGPRVGVRRVSTRRSTSRRRIYRRRGEPRRFAHIANRASYTAHHIDAPSRPPERV